MNANGTRLSGTTKELWNHWQQTKSDWRDLKSQEFEQKFLSDLLGTVDKTVAVIEDLDKLITRIKKECE